MINIQIEFESDEEVLEEVLFSEPNRWKVIFHNDDHTSMDFVVFLLVEIFHHTPRSANDIMIEIHEEGSGVVGIYDHEIAEEKALSSMRIARENNFPLEVTIEEE